MRLLWAACCLGFFGFLRAGEFTATSASLGSTAQLQISDVSFENQSSPPLMTLRLQRTKTDPFGKGVTIVLGSSGQPVCPVTAVRNFLAIRPAREGPLLIHADGTPLSREWLVKRVRQALEFCGISCAGYSGHSFRIGAATAAAEGGMPPHLIKTMGRWSSEAYLLYIRTPRATLATVSSLLARQLESVSTAPGRHPQPVHQLVREQISDGPVSAALRIQNLPRSS